MCLLQPILSWCKSEESQIVGWVKNNAYDLIYKTASSSHLFLVSSPKCPFTLLPAHCPPSPQMSLLWKWMGSLVTHVVTVIHAASSFVISISRRYPSDWAFKTQSLNMLLIFPSFHKSYDVNLLGFLIGTDVFILIRISWFSTCHVKILVTMHASIFAVLSDRFSQFQLFSPHS